VVRNLDFNDVIDIFAKSKATHVKLFSKMLNNFLLHYFKIKCNVPTNRACITRLKKWGPASQIGLRAPLGHCPPVKTGLEETVSQKNTRLVSMKLHIAYMLHSGGARILFRRGHTLTKHVT